ncbi:MAG: DUF2087 domain-containing protein [Nocardioidaceae bacterium]
MSTDRPDERQRILSVFMPDGRLTRTPAKAGKRDIVLEAVAQWFEPGERYAEQEVDAILIRLTVGGEADHVTLRRYLVDRQLLAREAGQYWRTGGWVTGT